MARDVATCAWGPWVTTVEHGEAGVVCTTRAATCMRPRRWCWQCRAPVCRRSPSLRRCRLWPRPGRERGQGGEALMLARGGDGIAVGIGRARPQYADTAEQGSVLVTGFGWQDDRSTAARRHVERAPSAPSSQPPSSGRARHDWTADPASRGTWLTVLAGRTDLFFPDRFDLLGRVAFAGPTWPGSTQAGPRGAGQRRRGSAHVPAQPAATAPPARRTPASSALPYSGSARRCACSPSGWHRCFVISAARAPRRRRR